jgi:hypothetical protein
MKETLKDGIIFTLKVWFILFLLFLAFKGCYIITSDGNITSEPISQGYKDKINAELDSAFLLIESIKLSGKSSMKEIKKISDAQDKIDKIINEYSDRDYKECFAFIEENERLEELAELAYRISKGTGSVRLFYTIDKDNSISQYFSEKYDKKIVFESSKDGSIIGGFFFILFIMNIIFMEISKKYMRHSGTNFILSFVFTGIVLLILWFVL